MFHIYFYMKIFHFYIKVSGGRIEQKNSSALAFGLIFYLFLLSLLYFIAFILTDSLFDDIYPDYFIIPIGFISMGFWFFYFNIFLGFKKANIIFNNINKRKKRVYNYYILVLFLFFISVIFIKFNSIE